MTHKLNPRCLAPILLAGLLAQSSLYSAEIPVKAGPEAVAQWEARRFGMFIHWGPISLTGQEISWSRANSNPACPNKGPIPVDVYDNLYKKFNPVGFNAKEWVATAKAAGMKYIVLTAKHCDGFLLWDSKVSDYNIMHTPFHRDICAELAKAAHESGMSIGWYYSPMDWRDPDCRNANNAEFVKRMQAELTELLSNYGKIDALWFDTDGHAAPWDQQNTYTLIRKLQPGIMINERLDIGDHGGWNQGVIGPWADFHTPEQIIGGYDGRPWESCMTVSARGQWSWGGASDGVKSPVSCINMLARCSGNNGNMLLDVGPRPDGVIDPAQTGLLKEIGQWLEVNGESIYGTRGGPILQGAWGGSTRKNNTIYIHVLSWSGNGVNLPPIPAKVLSVRALNGTPVDFQQTDDGISLQVPLEKRDAADTVIALDIDRPALDLPLLKSNIVKPNLATGAKATASNTYHDDPQYGPSQAVDRDLDTRWATDTGAKPAWIALNLGSPKTFSHVAIHECFANRIQKFALEYQTAAGAWKTILQGTTIGADFQKTFDPVTATVVRLNILETTDGPTISEIELEAK